MNHYDPNKTCITMMSEIVERQKKEVGVWVYEAGMSLGQKDWYWMTPGGIRRGPFKSQHELMADIDENL